MMPPPGYILIRPETLVGVQRAVEAALGARAAECLAAGGRAGGVKATAQLAGDAASRAGRLLEAGREIGWGDFALERLTSTALVVSVAGSPYARVPSHARRAGDAGGGRARVPRAGRGDGVRGDGRRALSLRNGGGESGGSW